MLARGNTHGQTGKGGCPALRSPLGPGLLVLLIILLNGCAGRTTQESFLRKDLDVGFVTDVAVFPFENNSQDRYASGRLRNVMITRVLASGLFNVVDKGLVDSVLNDEAVELGRSGVDPLVLKRLGQRLKVQAFFFGTVDSSGERHRGSVAVPEISATLRLVDAATGTILWQASGHRNGDSVAGRLLGVMPDDHFQVSLSLVRDLLTEIPAGVGGGRREEVTSR